MWDDGNLFQSRIAQSIKNEIVEYVDVNPFIPSYMDALDLYIVE